MTDTTPNQEPATDAPALAPEVVECEFHDAAWFAKRIGMGLDWVRHNTARLPHHRVGRKVRYSEESVAIFKEATKVAPTKPVVITTAAQRPSRPEASIVPMPTARSRAAHGMRGAS